MSVMSVIPAALSVPYASAAVSVLLLEGEDAVLALDSATASARSVRPANIFHSAELMRAVARTAGSANSRCLTACIFQNGSIATIWPLRITRDMGVTIATDLCDPISQYSDVIGAALSGDALMQIGAKLRNDFGVDALLARRVRSDSGLDAGFTETRATMIDENEAPFADLASCSGFDDYLGRFSKSTLRKIRQRRQRLEQEHGALSFDLLRGDEARAAVAVAVSWKRGWLAAQALASRVFDGGANETALIDASGAPNAHVSVLRAAGRPIAIELGLSCARHYAAYLGTFDPSFTHYSPGQEQMLRTIEWCFAQGFARYDLLPPGDSYKRHWTRGSTAERVRDYGIALSRVGGMYLFVRRHARARVQRAVEAMPAGMRLVARHYGKVAIGVGGTAAAVGLLTD
jgi:CelD/BcsL family acetyltransferase involved in cellulose biosynthesis